MTKFILHGGYPSTENAWNAGFYREISRYVPNDGNILLVYFSRDEEEYDSLFAQDKEKILEQADGKKLNIDVASKANFYKEMDWADAIYMRGGDTDKLIGLLKEHPEFEQKIKGKVVAGSSAGAYALSTYYHSASAGGIHKGLGLTPLRVICHYESDFHESAGDDPIKLMQDYPRDIELVALRDCEWKTFIFK